MQKRPKNGKGGKGGKYLCALPAQVRAESAVTLKGTALRTLTETAHEKMTPSAETPETR